MKPKKRNPRITSKIMSAIPSEDTTPELILRKALWKKNLRYRVNYKKLTGKPDTVFTKYRVAVFCDGDFWHGYNWAIRGLGSLEEELAGYSDFWKEKITRNMRHDKDVNQALVAEGWTVIRIWESDIRKNLDRCVEKIVEALMRDKYNQLEK